MRSVFAVVVMAVTLTACASLPKPVTVLSGAETQGGTAREGVTDSPAIWTGWMRRGDASPTNISFTVSTSSAGGLLVTDLDGAVTERIAGPRLGDIDATALPSDNGFTVLVGASGRSGRGMGLFFYKRSFDRDTALRYWGEVRTDQSEPRAFCMRQVSGVLKVVAADRRGDARVYHVTEGADVSSRARKPSGFAWTGSATAARSTPFRGWSISVWLVEALPVPRSPGWASRSF